jgi:hypothetical protein
MRVEKIPVFIPDLDHGYTAADAGRRGSAGKRSHSSRMDAAKSQFCGWACQIDAGGSTSAGSF